MINRKLVITTDIFYCLLEDPEFSENQYLAYNLLNGILNRCVNKICENSEILKNYEEFRENTKNNKYYMITNS